jgi:hypothetical protein
MLVLCRRGQEDCEELQKGKFPGTALKDVVSRISVSEGGSVAVLM